MLEELKSLEPRLKEILYRFLEEVQSTKAALYLFDEKDQFELVTQYGFRGDSAPPRYAASDEIIDRLYTKRAPYFINGLTADPRFSEMLYHADTSRILVAPVYSRGKLVGMVDLRDKAKQAPFGNDDVTRVQKITDQFLELFSEHNLYGQRPSTASEKIFSIAHERTEATETRHVLESRHPDKKGSQVLRVIDDANALISRGVLRARAGANVITDAHVSAASLLLPAVVAMPGVVVASVSPISRLGGLQVVAARAPLTDATVESFDQRIRAWLKKRGESGPVSARTNLIFPFGSAGAPIEPARLVTVLSAPVRVGAIDGLVLSVGFETNPDSSARANLDRFLAQAQQLATYASSADAASAMKQQVAEKLLEPDFHKYPELVAHSKRVSELAERLALHVGLEQQEVENIRLAALVHDVGMRLLDYRNLYRKSHLTSEEQRLLKSHPMVGAAIVADSALGPEIASLVMAHHERPDGTGYPEGLNGDRIPLGSKIIHICESYDAMTAPDSYQSPVPPGAAVAKIRRAGGTQFDAELASKFSDMIGTS